ncbi:DUF1772 domain-containing protein [Streptomyces solincola]|uniref:DUF1772 domain-containing protein n=1 Tax=Streptomyces solincola TaxID=2100817 RepID=A0A2S9PV20_9ACTN|nr:anthrone oxygenase family protein [Streptomyces solincola]PRH78276.1 DUF1772 domain-containing protein [Streptomyces solincola]
MPTLLLGLAIVSTGLYAGFMLVFQTGVMPALARLDDAHFVTAMRQVNALMPRGVFMTVFAGVLVFPPLVWAMPVDGRSEEATWLTIAGTVCAIANHLVTVVGNVPLNNALAAAPVNPPGPARAAFEGRWNAFHRMRTLLVTVAFALLVAAALV